MFLLMFDMWCCMFMYCCVCVGMADTMIWLCLYVLCGRTCLRCMCVYVLVYVLLCCMCFLKWHNMCACYDSICCVVVCSAPVCISSSRVSIYVLLCFTCV